MSTVIKGLGTAPSGADEEIVARPTILERFVRWLIRIDEEAPEEREWLLQLARREKLKLDLFEERQQRRKERDEQTKLIATWYYNYLWQGKEATLALEIRESNKLRKVSPTFSQRKNGGIIRYDDEYRSVMKLAMVTSTWSQIVRPWIEGTISTERMKEIVERVDDKERAHILFPLV